MAFGKKYNTNEYPPRHWSLVGKSGTGKSMFAARLKPTIAVIDADGQFHDVAFQLGLKDAFSISDNTYEMREVESIVKILDKNMRGANVGTLVIDSITPIIKRIVTETMQDKEFARVTDFRVKAQAMRILIDSVTNWGTDVLWIYHTEESYDKSGNLKQSTSVTPVELARLQKHINAKLEIVVENGKYGIKVLWSRGRSGATIWDETGLWEGMPEKLEEYMYGNLTEEERKEIVEQATFRSPEEAWAWAMEQGVFADVAHAKNSYEKLKKELYTELGTLTADIMYEAWREKVKAKVDEKEESND